MCGCLVLERYLRGDISVLAISTMDKQLLSTGCDFYAVRSLLHGDLLAEISELGRVSITRET